MLGCIGQLASLAKTGSGGFAETSAELADTPKDNYDFGLQRWMKKRGKFYRPNLSANEVKEYKDAFRIIDLDGSGTLEVDELVQAMRALDQPVSAYEMTKLVELIAPGKGCLNETDFIELVHYRSLPNSKKQKEQKEKDVTGQEKPQKVQVSMGILAGTFRRKKALDLLMLPWEVRSNATQEAGRQSELAQILIPPVPLESVVSPIITHNHKTLKASRQHEGSPVMSAPSNEGQDLNDTNFTEHLLSMPLLPLGLSKKLRNEAIRQTIPTSYSAPLMSRIEAKIKTEVDLETSEISKTAFYLPPVHKRIPQPYIETVDTRCLSPKSGYRSQALGLIEQDDFERQKRLLLKKYSFPSNNPIEKTPREMQEPYAFMAKQLTISKETAMHAKQRAKKNSEKSNVNVFQVMKDAESLLQTAKIVLRESRRQAQEAAIIHPTEGLSFAQRSASPSSLNSSPKVISDAQYSNLLNNSPIAPNVNSIQKSGPTKMPLQQHKHGINPPAGPVIRIFKAELAPVNRHRTKAPITVEEFHSNELNGANENHLLIGALHNTEKRETESFPKKKSLVELERVSSISNHDELQSK